jgi:hypothetical protein
LLIDLITYSKKKLKCYIFLKLFFSPLSFV